MQTVKYLEQHDAHLIAWLSAVHNVTVVHNIYTREFVAYAGDYDLDADTYTDSTAWEAALEFASQYDAATFDKLCEAARC